MSTLTIEELTKKYKIKKNPTTLEDAGELMKYELLRSSGLKVDDEYQRLISAIAIQGYGKLNRDLLATTLVSRRPESLGDWAGDFIFDGQHKAIMPFISGIETDDNHLIEYKKSLKEFKERMRNKLAGLKAVKALDKYAEELKTKIKDNKK